MLSTPQSAFVAPLRLCYSHPPLPYYPFPFFAALAARFSISVLAAFFLVLFWCPMPLAIVFSCDARLGCCGDVQPHSYTE